VIACAGRRLPHKKAMFFWSNSVLKFLCHWPAILAKCCLHCTAWKLLGDWTFPLESKSHR
jgi:hypothetical protein